MPTDYYRRVLLLGALCGFLAGVSAGLSIAILSPPVHAQVGTIAPGVLRSIFVDDGVVCYTNSAGGIWCKGAGR